jgi:PAS domain S-box-containing protein
LTVALLFNGLLGAFLLIVTGNKLSIEQIAEEKFRLLISAIKDYSIIMLDQNGNITNWNEGAEKILGYKSTEIQGKNFSKFYSQEAIKSNRPALDLEIVRNFDTLQTDQWRIRKGGVKFLANIVISAIKNSEGQLMGFVQVIRDLTEYKNKEAILKKSEELYRNLFNSAQDIVAIAKFNGTLLSVNPAFETITGWSKEQWLGKSYRKIIVPEDLILLESVIDKVSKGYTPPPFECRIYTKNNEIKTVESTIRPILEDRKPATKSLIISRDVTYRKYSEELVKSVQENLERQVKERTAQLTTSNENLQKVNCELEKFTSIASHDLREPLRTISNYMSLLSLEFSEKLGTKAMDYINFSIDATKRMQRLVADLLNYSLVGTTKEKFKKVNYQIVLEKVLSDLKVKIEENNATIQIADSLPTMLSDETQIAQLFQNLIGNAIKYRGKKDPHIEISCRKKNYEWYFSVKDNGIGFDMKYADKIFQAFHRLHERNEYPGTGIGLAICKKIIDRHKGKIWVESKIHQGSTFHFAIPIQQETHPVATRILYADDSAEMRDSIKKIIEIKEEVQVDTARNGEECLEMALKKTYDLILMDIQMPIMDGTEATIELRKKGFKKPIIAFTGHYIIQQDNKTFYQKDGFTDYFSKNDDISTLSNFIEKYVTTV